MKARTKKELNRIFRNFFLMRKASLLILMTIFFVNGIFSQTASGSFTQTPCNNDGVFTVNTTGIPLPITYTYYVGGTTIVHSNVNSSTDQLNNIPLTSNSWIDCLVSGGGVSQWASDSYNPPFYFYLNSTPAICPSTMGMVSATQANGTPGPFSYSWINKQTLNSYTGNNVSVPTGEYSAIITDLTTGCVLEALDSGVYVYEQSGISVSMSTTAANCIDGTATANPTGGLAPYTYLWSNGATTPTISNLVKGYYSVVVTDAQGCSQNKGAYIYQAINISINESNTDATCLQNDGSSIAFASGGTPPYNYAWSNAQTGSTANGLSGSTIYSVLVIDANGCIGKKNIYIGTSTPINVTYSTTPSQCTSASGSATLIVSGGLAPYTYNWSSFPAVTGNTLSNVDVGTYQFEVVDADGCIRTGSVVIPPISTINASAQGGTVTCPNTTGSALVNVSGSNAPFTYLWSNGATTSQINSVPLGSYSCLVTDALGCSVTKSATIKSVSPISLYVSTIPATCIFNSDGSASPNVSGGLAPYTYSYTNGTTTANATGLSVGNYYLTVTDANGCSKSKFFSIGNSNTTTSCYCTISGKVYEDANSDCVYNVGEVGIEDIMIHCSGYGYTYTDANGNYSFKVPTGTYTITEQIKPYYPLTACQSNNISVSVVAASGCNNVVDFANDIIPIVDLKVSTFNSTLPPIPGNSYQQKVVVKNLGTTTESDIQMGYEHDGQLAFVNSSLATFIQPSSSAPNAYGVQSGFPSLNANETQVMLLNYNTPTNIPVGTAVSFKDSVADLAPIATNWLVDNSPWNNIDNYQTIVIGSYDPNYKEVSPKGEGEEGFISSETKELNYTIHFQNEGTYFAQKVVVTDQLDADLDWTTLRPGYSDYNYTAIVSETGLITFTFDSIYLPWKSQYGDALSSGLVNFSIELKEGLSQGIVIENNADIYFDYNEPIRTNTTINTLKDNDNVTGIEDLKLSSLSEEISLTIYPVPAKDLITIRLDNILKDKDARLEIIDMMGQVVSSNQISLNKGSSIVKQTVSNLARGTYLTRVQFSNGDFVVEKIVLMKD